MDDALIDDWLRLNVSDSESEDEAIDEEFDDDIGDMDPGEEDPIIPQPFHDETQRIVAGKKKSKPIPLVWLDHSEVSPNNRPSAFDFSGTPGIKVPIENNTDPYELFRLFITDELVDMIVRETNRYAEKYLAYRPLKEFSRFHAWKPTNRDEIYILLSVYILHGLVWKPEINCYYTQKPLFATPGFPSIMTLNRLKLLSRFLHFVNDEVPVDGCKKLQKLKPVFDYICDRFITVYTPERDIAIDESLLLWKGRLSFKQFIRIKRARFGIKSYILSESSTGYIWKLKIYLGKGTDILHNPDVGHATNVVLTLLNGLENQGYRVYTDNFYCSPELALELQKIKTDVVGTVKKNRLNLPKDLLTLKLKKGEMSAVYEENGKMTCIKWMDKRAVLCLSTVHQMESTEVSRKGKKAIIPTIVNDYNKLMGGVDRVDQMLSAYPVERKRQKRWYKKEFRHLLNMCIFNSHVLHTKNGGKKTSYEFRQALVESLIEHHLGENVHLKRGRPSLENNPLRLKERHFPDYVPATEKKTNATRRCVVCASKKIRRESRYMCVSCDVGLCAAPCFKDFHTKKNY